jgi:hypothetical protein
MSAHSFSQPVQQFAAADVSERFKYFVFIEEHAGIIGNQKVACQA